ncbi:MAG: 30S ribosomal protein S15 [Planctomycetaceae bacterium]|nr:30S ribosomal protein S15 [Planctomycetaceae bacterium]
MTLTKERKKELIGAHRRGTVMVSRRRRLLDYLKRVAPQRYLDIIKRLDIRK